MPLACELNMFSPVPMRAVFMAKNKFVKINFLTILGFLVAVLLNCNFITDAADMASPRERLPLDFGWKFYLGNPWGDVIELAKADGNGGPAKPDFSDADWRTVDLPHDWAVELPFDSSADCNHGFKP